MGELCCVKTCKAKRIPGGPSFHKFPRDPALRNSWHLALDPANVKQLKYPLICINHFREEDIQVVWGKNFIKTGAIPSIVSFEKKPQHQIHTDPDKEILGTEDQQENYKSCQNTSSRSLIHEIKGNPGNSKNVPSTSSSRFTQEVEDIQQNEESFLNTSMKRKIYSVDYSIEDMENAEKAKKFYVRARVEKAEVNKRNNTLRTEVKRLEAEVNNLKELLELCTKKQVLSESAALALQKSSEDSEYSFKELNRKNQQIEEPGLFPVERETVEESPLIIPQVLPFPVLPVTQNVDVEDPETKSNRKQKPPTHWSILDVFEFIRGLPDYSNNADAFKVQEIDGPALLMLKVNHLMTAMSMNSGHAAKLISHIDIIKKDFSLLNT